ncbi:Translation initiation factor SUI1 [uncultured Paludibacter sp.]|uniref:Translation initiation factor SUI1 n=1 Tax=uncultured Paludibacter sp. TaxID=497635 RepID=A0A653AKR3_9BACT|nr:Translation initiation factor SUI1 [uncultured Paludibacter sp.]
MKNSDWKDKLNALLPSDYVPEPEEETTSEKNILPAKQTLRVELDKRNGKPATIISEFQGTDDELKELAKTLKNKCAAGGSQRDGEILIQGDFRIKVADILQNMGFKVKRINFK